LLDESDKAQILTSDDVSYEGKQNLKWGITKPNAVIEDSEHVLYQMPSFKTSCDHDIFVTHRFLVKLKNSEDLTVLQEMANQYQAEIEKQADAMPLWYILRWGLNGSHTALELANIFYESGEFAVSEPEFMGDVCPENEEHADIQVLHDQAKRHKILRDGQMYIEREGKEYTIMGHEVK